MKNVQTYLRELDIQKLIRTYFEMHPIEYYYLYKKHPETTIKRIVEVHHKNLFDFIQKLKEMPVSKPENAPECLLYVIRSLSDDDNEMYRMMHMEDLLHSDSDFTDYAFEITPQSEIIGFWVADTPLTQKNIYELISSTLFSACFFGTEQEGIDEFIQSLEQAANEGASAPSSKISADKMNLIFGLPTEKETDEELELHQKFYEIKAAYFLKSRQTERAKIRALLLKDESFKY